MLRNKKTATIFSGFFNKIILIHYCSRLSSTFMVSFTAFAEA